MGMDIYGIKPLKLIADAVEPVRPQEEAPKEEWDVYLKARDEFNSNVMPGRYFRANLWSWRPIQAMCSVINATLNLKFDMSDWGNNSGAGLETQEDCNTLATGLDEVISGFEADGIGKVYLDVSSFVGGKGMYVKLKGVDNTALATGISEFLSDEEIEGKYKDAIKHFRGQGLYPKTPYVIEDPNDEYVLIEPAHSIYVPHIREFVRFLRNCGGFEIW